MKISYIFLVIFILFNFLMSESNLIKYNSLTHNNLISYVNPNNFNFENKSFKNKKNDNQILQLIFPGYGYWRLNKKKKAIFFSSMEFLFIGSWLHYENKAKRLENDFKKFADDNWSLDRWWINTPKLSSRYGDVICEGTHHLNIFISGEQSTISSDDLCSNGWIDGLEIVKDHDFYENIGKYDQFVAGWSDLLNVDGTQNWWEKNKDVGDSTEIIVMTANKRNYIDQRKKSNFAYNIASYMITGIMFNHLISYIDIFLIKKNNEKNISSNIKINSFIHNDYKGLVINFRW